MNEREMEVLEHYPFQPERISRVRGAFLCETKQGNRLLRETTATEKRLRWETEILRKLEAVSDLKVDPCVENAEGMLLTESFDRRFFCLREWPAGRECDVESEEELIRGMMVLGQLHLALGKISTGLTAPEPGEPRRVTWYRHNRELIRARNYIRKKRRKSELERKILEAFPFYYEQAERVLALGDFVGIPRMQLCHGEYTHHHLLYHGKQTGIIDFSHMGWGARSEDVGLFFRKAMEKHDWKPELGFRLLQGYESMYPMDHVDRCDLYSQLAYPEKFWKQVNFYYNRRKSWMPVRSLEKLNLLDEQREKKAAFLKELEKYWQIGSE